MKCSACNANQATVQFTDVTNGVPNTRTYCVACAKKIGLFNMSFPADEVFKSFDNVMKSFDEIFKGINLDNTPKVQEITCGDCGMTLSKFKQLGRFGCAKDYELFKVAPILEKIHGASVHTGKTPTQPGDKVKQLKKDMEAAVKSENYEKAASLRDEIKKLETSR